MHHLFGNFRFSRHALFDFQIDGLTGKSWSFEQLEAESTNLAKHLYTLGLRPHHVACLYGTNRSEFAHIVSGVALNNAALTISNSQLTPGNPVPENSSEEVEVVYITPDRRQSKTLILSMNVDQK